MGGESSWLTRIAATSRRFIVRADEKLTDFVELESVIRAPNRCCGPDLLPRVHSS